MKIHYDVIGDGFPLVFLHALGTDHRAMQAWSEPVFQQRPGYQRIYVDLPAHGRSDIGDDATTSDDLLAGLLDSLDTLLGDRRFALVAKSFGGYMAQGIFHRKSALIDGLCLLAPALHRTDRALPPHVVLERDESALSGLEPDAAAAVETLFVLQTKASIAAFLQEVQPGRLLANRAFLTSEWRTKGYFFSFDPFESDKVYPQPVLLLLGRQDAICGYQDHLTLLSSFPHASCSILDRAGHMLEVEQRRTVQSLFSDWLDRLESFQDSSLEKQPTA